MKKNVLSIVTKSAFAALSFSALAAPIEGQIPCPQSFVDLLNNEVYGPNGSFRRLAEGMVDTVEPLSNCQLKIMADDSHDLVNIVVMNVNPKFSYSVSNWLGRSSGVIRLNADVKAEFKKENGQCTGTHCDFTRNGTEGDFIAKELIHTKFNNKVASHIDQPFKAAFEAYLQHSDFWPTVVSFVEGEVAARQAQAQTALDSQNTAQDDLLTAAVTNLFNKRFKVSQIAETLEITVDQVYAILAKI